jgi:hypothetical protein
MSVNHRFPVPFIPVTGKVLNGTNGPVKFGDLQDLAGSVSVGLYDADTDALATPSGNGKVFYIGYSSEHTKDFLDKWMFGMQLPRGGESFKFRGEDVFKFEVSEPQRVKDEKWVLGYDGSAGCNETIPAFECGKVYGVRIVASGSPVFRRWAKALEHEIFTDPICCGDQGCSTGCPDDKIDCETIVKDLVKKITEHTELQQIGVKARYITNTYAATTPTHFDYCISLCDGGTSVDLGNLQQTLTEGKVERIDRVGGVSKYKVTCIASLPAAFTPTSSVSLADCGTCPVGYTTVAATDVYTVVRPLAGTETLVTDGNKATYAASIATAYTAYTPTLPVFLSQNGATASVQIEVPKGTVPVALLSDTLIKGITKEAVCVPPANTAVVWTQCGSHYKVQRDLCVTLARKDCAAGNYLADIQAFYATVPSVVAGSITVTAGDACSDVYGIKQWSTCMDDACLSRESATFTNLPGFATSDGKTGEWQEVVPTIPVYDENKKCGLEISAKIPERYLSDCATELQDFYEEEPIRLEVSWIHDSYTGFPEACKIKFPSAKRVQNGQVANQSGEWLLREYIKAGAYEVFSNDFGSQKMRELLDSNRRAQIDRKAFYKIYYLQANTFRKAYNFGQHPETIEAMFFFKETDPKAIEFENAFGKVLSKFGVTLKKR